MDTLEPIEVEVQSHALVLPDQARAIIIRDARDFAAAGEFLKLKCKAVLQEISRVFDPIVTKAKAAYDEARHKRDEVSAPVLEAERIVKVALADYSAKAEKEAAEQRRVALEAERQRVQDALLAQAATLEAQGRDAMAAQTFAKAESPLVRVPADMTPPAPKVAGVSFSSAWSYEVIDEALIKREYLIPDATRIGKLVRVEHERAAELIGGIRVYEKRIVRSTA